ncbi:hypothetical protein ACQKM2_22120 [Streptomyces sp. NPDC004126]|uniref:hypothetical protein n=1 Tax=Streptomyces sp. NPDC004126 TaxID=3390695 RepID=UPI003CFEB5CD
MTRTVRHLAGRIAEALLPETSASAGCARECWKVMVTTRNQTAGQWCCIWEDCRMNCN